MNNQSKIKSRKTILEYDNLAKEWHKTKNDGLFPQEFTFGSHKRVWWQCSSCGYEWKAIIKDRTRGRGCPACSGRIVTDKNRLSLKHPEVVNEWHPHKNNNLKPENVSFGSNKKVWWICSKCRYEWKAYISKRAQGHGCPHCAGKIITKKKCLSSTHPKLVKEWHLTKNGELKPEKFSYGSHKKIWWQCSTCKYEWKTSIKARTNGNGCPACSGRVVTDKNRITITHPNITKEWHPIKNGDYRPEFFSYGSSKKIWWQCSSCGHEWKALIKARTNGNGCPACAGSIVTDKNRLTLTYPSIIDEWDFSKNRKKPEQFPFGTQSKVWWKCKVCNYEWYASIKSRTSLGRGCPSCVGQVVTYNNRLDLKYPEIIVEWHPTKNKKKPSEYSSHSGKAVWWLCKKCGHEWRTKISTRTTSGCSCPECALKKDIHGELPRRWEEWCEEVAKLLFINYQFQFTGIRGIRPDIVVQITDRKIAKRTTYFDLIIDAKTNAQADKIESTIGNYASYCKKLEIWHLFGHRQSFIHHDLNTSKRTPISFISSEELIQRIQDPVKREAMESQLEKLLEGINNSES